MISFHNVSKEVEAAVREGPDSGEQSLEHFLQNLSRLKGALDYFEKNNPQSIELENVRSLYEIGVTRDPSGHITGFSGSASFLAAAPNIDGGVTFGPTGVLFVTTFSNNGLLQFLPGSAAPDSTTRQIHPARQLLRSHQARHSSKRTAAPT